MTTNEIPSEGGMGEARAGRPITGGSGVDVPGLRDLAQRFPDFKADSRWWEVNGMLDEIERLRAEAAEQRRRLANQDHAWKQLNAVNEQLVREIRDLRNRADMKVTHT